MTGVLGPIEAPDILLLAITIIVQNTSGEVERNTNTTIDGSTSHCRFSGRGKLLVPKYICPKCILYYFGNLMQKYGSKQHRPVFPSMHKSCQRIGTIPG